MKPLLVVNAGPGARSLDAGDAHTCVIAPNSGGALCWGRNALGQLGNGGTIRSATPTLVAGGLQFSSVSGGSDITCGTTMTYGVYCWGAETLDQYTGQPQTTPKQVVQTFLNLSPLGAVPPRAENFRVTVGFQFACVYYADYSPSVAGHIVDPTSRSTRCWGENWFGQGGSDPNSQPVLQPFSSTGQSDLTRVSAGAEFTCADQPGGNVGCFGSNYYGQLGVPPNVMSQSFRPVPVARSGTLHGVVTGIYHACALDANGAAWCWGDSGMGKLGAPGAYGVSMIPTAVPGGLTFRALAAGNEHTCGITTDNRVYCWGENWYGQLGTGDHYDRSNVPVIVMGT